MLEVGESIKFGFAHLKTSYVEDLLYLLEQWAQHHTIDVWKLQEAWND